LNQQNTVFSLKPRITFEEIERGETAGVPLQERLAKKRTNVGFSSLNPSKTVRQIDWLTYNSFGDKGNFGSFP
jgi:hypothetical protein